MAIYPQASTMVELNKEIKGLKGKKSQRELTKQYNVSRLTIRNWQNRDEREGRHHRPHTFQAKQTPVRERLASELRRLLLLPLGHLLVITWELIHLIATRSGIYRTLNRHGAFRLREPETACKEEGGEQIQEGGKRKYLYVAIDRVSRWGYIETLFHKSVSNAIEFLKWLIEKPPFNISRILTDNDKKFTDRFMATGEHLFDQLCAVEPWCLLNGNKGYCARMETLSVVCKLRKAVTKHVTITLTANLLSGVFEDSAKSLI